MFESLYSVWRKSFLWTTLVPKLPRNAHFRQTETQISLTDFVTYWNSPFYSTKYRFI